MYSADIYVQKDTKPTRVAIETVRDLMVLADKLEAYAVTEYLDGGKASMIRLGGDWICL